MSDKFSKDQHDKWLLLQTQNTHSKTLTFTLKHKQTASILNFKQVSIALSQNISIILRSYEVKIVVILPSLTKLICNLEAVQISMARSSHTWCVFVWTQLYVWTWVRMSVSHLQYMLSLLFTIQFPRRCGNQTCNTQNHSF